MTAPNAETPIDRAFNATDLPHGEFRAFKAGWEAKAGERERDDAWRWIVYVCGHEHHFKVDVVAIQTRTRGPYCPVCGTSTVTRFSTVGAPNE